MEQTALAAAKPIKLPGPNHPIAIERNPNRVGVLVAGRIVADTREALTLREAAYPAVQYIPRKDVDMALLDRTDHTTYRPYKGDCAYFSIPLGGERSTNAVWSYEAPYASVAAIDGHLAFYPDRVDAIEERPVASTPCHCHLAPSSARMAQHGKDRRRRTHLDSAHDLKAMPLVKGCI